MPEYAFNFRTESNLSIFPIDNNSNIVDAGVQNMEHRNIRHRDIGPINHRV